MISTSSSFQNAAASNLQNFPALMSTLWNNNFWVTGSSWLHKCWWC